MFSRVNIIVHYVNREGLKLKETRHFMILVNNQLDAQFFMYVYFYSLHVSGSYVPITRRIIVSMRHLVYVNVWIIVWYAYQTVIYKE